MSVTANTVSPAKYISESYGKNLSQVLETDSDYIAALAEYVTQSPSSYHAVAAAAKIFEQHGFEFYAERDAWPRLTAGQLAYTVRDGAIIAWRVGGGAHDIAPQPGFALRIFGAHTDSPGFIVKPVPGNQKHGWQQLNVEVYGGPLLNSWLDRDLALAGRVQLINGQEKLIRTAAVARIPQLAIHLENPGESGLRLDKQQHMQPILSAGEHNAAALIAAAAGVDYAEIAGFELCLADTQAPQLIGANQEFFASARMDNLSSTFAGVMGLLNAEVPAGQVAMFVSYDYEEVGSLTYAGAHGTFLADTLQRLNDSAGGAVSDLMRTKAASYVMSADAGHGIHPNYPEKHDPVVYPELGKGPMRKVNANQRYATDAVSGWIWETVQQRAAVQGQVFVSNNATPCGTTIGPITAAVSGIRTFDVGVPLLSMHSARELAHKTDLWGLAQIAKTFFAL